MLNYIKITTKSNLKEISLKFFSKFNCFKITILIDEMAIKRNKENRGLLS